MTCARWWKYRIRGKDAAAYLNHLTVRDASKLSVGGVHYTIWCDDAGKIIDDGTLFRLGQDEYRICCQERHLPWFQDAAYGYDVDIAEVTEDIAALSLQGPTSCTVLKEAGFRRVDPQALPHGILPLQRGGTDGVAYRLHRRSGV